MKTAKDNQYTAKLKPTLALHSGWFAILMLVVSGIHAQDTIHNPGSEFIIDMTGDRRTETVSRIEYMKKKSCEMCPGGAKTRYFIKYISVSQQNDTTVIFDHECGEYWSYGIEKFLDINNDGLIDAIYYEGDDVSEQWVVIINHLDSFRAIYLGEMPIDQSYSIDENFNVVTTSMHDNSPVILAKWDTVSSGFIGISARWPSATNIYFKDAPNEKAGNLELVNSSDLLILLDDESHGGWLNLCGFETCGWLNEKQVSERPPEVIFR